MLQRNRIIPTIFLFPLLYLFGWLTARPILLLKQDISSNHLSLIGTLFTLLFYLLLLPGWVNSRWEINKHWNALGLGIFKKKIEIITFLKGFSYSLMLITMVLIFVFSGEWIEGFGPLSFKYIFNAIGLIFLVGFAEELIFRGWLWGEMCYLYGQRRGIIIQSIIFSVLHIRFQLPLIELIPLLFGFFLLGIVLSMRRILDSGSIWGCIGLHGGLVGIWFAINSGLIKYSIDAPNWVIGPGDKIHNPIGGIIAIISLIIIIFSQRHAFQLRRGLFFGATVNDSSRGAAP